jgi:mannan endo-1,4-beta-mannosidase
MKRFLTFLIFLSLTINSPASESVFTQFVYRDGDKLMDENGELSFISFNIPCLHYNEDNMAFTETNPWRLPDEFEIADALEAVRQMGGQVVRIYALSVRSKGEDSNIPRHIIGPGQMDEKTFESLDMVLAVANRKGIRVIIPFIDNWKWWGGIEAVAAFRDKNAKDFWTDPELFEDYKKIVSFVINRTNTVTGVKYRDDKAILAWETGNELVCPHEWTARVTAYLKSLDPNHLVLDGYHTTILREESIQDENVDIVTTHHYSKNPEETISQIRTNAEMARGKKPYFVGEFGFIPTDGVETVLRAVIYEKTSGALIWSLRYRNRDGGFYWHSEPYGGDLFKAYHWPGFTSGAVYDEAGLLALMRRKAYEIRNIPVPEMKIPSVPVLLEINDVAAISWRGSAGAQSYILERAESKEGPWIIVGEDISDAVFQYRPLFNDTSVEVDKKYYYRIKAKNSAGTSESSGVSGPVYAAYKTLVDEMQNQKLIHKSTDELSLEAGQARNFKEDSHRLKGTSGACITYKVGAPINSWKVYSFFTKDISDFKFYISEDGENFEQIEYIREDYFAGKGEYDYHKPVLYKGLCSGENAMFLKIEFTGEAQISRVEIKYGRKLGDYSHTNSPIGFIKGHSWGWTGWRGQYLGDGPVDSMKKLAETGADWICISFGAVMQEPNDPRLFWAEKNPRMVTDDEIRRAIELARQNNLKIILKPVVNVLDGTWRSWIKFETLDGEIDMQAWDKWWTDFRLFLLHYASIAEETGCEMYCLGCEMGSTEPFEGRWRCLIADIRQIYNGAITYDTNHGEEDKIAWWDAVDVISISAYYPIGTDNVELALQDDLSKVPPSDSSVEALKRRLEPTKEIIRKVSKEFDRPVFFIELGMCSARGCSAAPWTHNDPNMIYDGDEQKRFYQAMFESFWDEPWFLGYAWWDWPTALYSRERAEGNTSFCIYGKPAE